MASLIYPTEDNGLNGPIIMATVEEAEAAWGNTRSEWGWEEAEDTDAVVITLGLHECGVWARHPGEDGEIDHAIWLDYPQDTASQMAQAFALALDETPDWEDVAPQYAPSLARC